MKIFIKNLLIQLVGYLGNIGVSLIVAGLIAIFLEISQSQNDNAIILLICGIIFIIFSAIFLALTNKENNHG
jgi:uncharacterized membrane protein HdeD (DUF308 family)